MCKANSLLVEHRNFKRDNLQVEGWDLVGDSSSTNYLIESLPCFI